MIRIKILVQTILILRDYIKANMKIQCMKITATARLIHLEVL